MSELENKLRAGYAVRDQMIAELKEWVAGQRAVADDLDRLAGPIIEFKHRASATRLTVLDLETFFIRLWEGDTSKPELPLGSASELPSVRLDESQ